MHAATVKRNTDVGTTLQSSGQNTRTSRLTSCHEKLWRESCLLSCHRSSKLAQKIRGSSCSSRWHCIGRGWSSWWREDRLQDTTQDTKRQSKTPPAAPTQWPRDVYARRTCTSWPKVIGITKAGAVQVAQSVDGIDCWGGRNSGVHLHPPHAVDGRVHIVQRPNHPVEGLPAAFQTHRHSHSERAWPHQGHEPRTLTVGLS